ncbi:hypothetical protein B0H16DRAFT_1901711 [Mycena metata]|uniref:DUF6589 domain-containing protein n=1 Tax=Mycena metata TaxID=1033252 RepID=A0AAD7GV09_9AGAR|nr:hypothetical protein B0H16DRAFT_1901711 [Mycena metata]
MPPKRKTLDSDPDYRVPSSLAGQKRTRTNPQHFFTTSSAPTSPRSSPAPELESADLAEDEQRIEPLPAFMSQLLDRNTIAGPSTSSGGLVPPETPRKQRATSDGPSEFPSPATSTIFDPSPVKPRGGRPRVAKAIRNPRNKKNGAANAEAQAAAAAARRKHEADRKAEKRAVAAEARRIQQEAAAKAKAVDDHARAQDFFNKITKQERRGAELFREIVERVPEVGEEFVDKEFDAKLEKVLQAEGLAIQELLSRHWTTSVTELLKEFDMEQLGQQLQGIAPTLWKILERVSIPSQETRRMSDGASRREKTLIFTTVCAMLSMARSQKANNYQVVIGMFLLASGAAKREMEVLAHAGLSISYSAIQEHLTLLSDEALKRLKQLVKEKMCFIVWDNLNIVFRVESQRLNSTNHFDNGTTGTAIPLWNPFTNSDTPLGTLPLGMKPTRTTTFPVLDWSSTDTLPSPTQAEELGRCCGWQLRRLAIDNIPALGRLKEALGECPEVDPIAVHQTEQYPVPAMHEDESSMEGTIRVYTTILCSLGITDADLRAHGLMFNDGDLLTDSLVDKIESARRNSTGETEGMKATRKPMTAGWKAKKATPWKPSHELLQISLAAHVKDGFRLHCGQADLDAWAATATMDDVNAVADRVHDKLFSTAGLDAVRALRPELRDITHENVILLNRDALFYIEFVFAIKKGDIGRVVNVLRVWMVMMRSNKTMPKYADAIFETLARIDRYDPVLKRFFLHNWLVNLTGRPYSFKEVDLLQKHQNFWAKIIYNAKGVNRSWEWLSKITVCIFTLREAMRTVQKTYKIPAYGERHTVPDMTKEVQTLADALRDEKIQEHVNNRGSVDSSSVAPVRDLLEEGSKYADTRTAFKKFTPEVRRAENLGVVDPEEVPEAEEREDAGTTEEDYDVTEEDLYLDEEEPYAHVDT